MASQPYADVKDLEEKDSFSLESEESDRINKKKVSVDFVDDVNNQ